MANDSSNVAVKVKDLHKSFRLPHEQHNGLKQLLLNFTKRKKGYEEQHVLNDISFDIKKGEFFGIVGRNGSGKSTLLKLLAGIYSPDFGSVNVNGSLTPFIELGVGFNHELTGRENVFLNGALLGFSRDEMEAMYEDIVSFAELDRFMDQKLKNYSSGMQVRLAFSIAIRADSDILLIDEVLAVGDSNFQRKCFEYFNTLKNSKKTVIFVSHDSSAVQRYCDRAILLEKGKIVAEGDPTEVFDTYTESNIKRHHAEQKKPGEKLSTNWAEIKKVSLLNGDGEAETTFRPNETMTIRVECEAKKELINPIIRFVAVPVSGGMGVFGGSTKDNFEFGTIAKEHEFGVEFQTKNIFNDTDFSIHVSLFDNQQRDIIARHSNAVTLSSLGWTTDLVTQVYPSVHTKKI